MIKVFCDVCGVEIYDKEESWHIAAIKNGPCFNPLNEDRLDFEHVCKLCKNRIMKGAK